MKTVSVLAYLLTAAIVGCEGAPSDESAMYSGVIHPKVFEMVESWVSDTEQPVVTEVNLDAVARNRNQFDFDDVSTVDGWTHYADEERPGYLQYKPIESEGSVQWVEFQHNGGGNWTSSVKIGYTIARRRMVTEEGEKEIQVLRVEGMR